MTEQLFQEDCYLKEFDARVTAIDEAQHAVVLDRTAFYPGGGGQPHDMGTLEADGVTYPVVKVKKSPEGILHFIAPDQPLPLVGAVVTGKLDWERRHALMRTHSALHVLCGVIFRDYGAHVTGAEMDPLSGRMDFEFENMTHDLAAAIEKSINEAVAEEHPIEIKSFPREEAFQIPDLIRTRINLLPPGIETVRTVNIVGLDLQADGGTHVSNTREIGTIKVTDYKSKGKINKRLYIAVS